MEAGNLPPKRAAVEDITGHTNVCSTGCEGDFLLCSESSLALH